MKKLLTKEKQEKRKQRNQLIIGGILIALMIFSTAGYAITDNKSSGSSEKITYNKIVFTKDSSEYWYFNFQGANLAVKNNPEETKSISSSINLDIQDYSNKPLYFVGDSEEPILELKRNLSPFVLRINDACLTENCSGNFPVKNCSADNIIIVQENLDREMINQEDKCIYISASQNNQTMYADAVLFKILGI